MMIEVFKTNVTQKPNAKKIITHLHAVFPDASANFDLQDTDHVLRVETSHPEIDVQQIIRLVEEAGFCCEVLND